MKRSGVVANVSAIGCIGVVTIPTRGPLPQIVREAANGLADANVSVLNGADGLSELASGLVAQGMSIFEAVRRGVNGQVGQETPRSRRCRSPTGRAAIRTAARPPDRRGWQPQDATGSR